MDLASAKMIGAGLACIALVGAGIGIGNVFASLITALARNPAAAGDAVRLPRLRARRGDRAVRPRDRVPDPVRVLTGAGPGHAAARHLDLRAAARLARDHFVVLYLLMARLGCRASAAPSRRGGNKLDGDLDKAAR